MLMKYIVALLCLLSVAVGAVRAESVVGKVYLCTKGSSLQPCSVRYRKPLGGLTVYVYRLQKGEAYPPYDRLAVKIKRTNSSGAFRLTLPKGRYYISNAANTCSGKNCPANWVTILRGVIFQVKARMNNSTIFIAYEDQCFPVKTGSCEG